MRVHVSSATSALDAIGGTLRRVPAQARSRERLARILRAADDVLAAGGVGTFTLGAVADEAGVPVGSIYHFFADKDALVDALAIVAWSTFAERIRAVADRAPELTLEEAVAATVDVLQSGLRDARGFRALWYGPLRTQRVRDATRPTRQAFVVEVRRVLGAHWTTADAADLELAAQMTVLIGDGLLREAFRVDPEGDPTLLRELQVTVRAYLAARLDAPA
jgi:AcrR family transcriptional regulator